MHVLSPIAPLFTNTALKLQERLNLRYLNTQEQWGIFMCHRQWLHITEQIFRKEMNWTGSKSIQILGALASFNCFAIL